MGFGKLKRLLTAFSALAVFITLILPIVITSQVKAAPGLSVQGAVLDVTLSPGGTWTHTMTITNSADYSLDMQAEARGFGQSLDGSTIALLPQDDSSPYSARTFISNIDKTSFLLDPGNSQQIQATIDVPADTAPGIRYAIIYIYSQPGSGDGMGIVMATNILVIIRVPGSELVNSGEITSLELSDIASGEPIQVHTTFENSGNIHYKVKNRVSITDEAEQIISQSETALSSSSIIPGFSRLITTTLSPTEGTDNLPPGQYFVESRIALDDGTLLDTEETSFTIFEDGTIEVGKPTADFSANVTSGDIPLTVNFSDKSIGNSVSWAWDFDNDGTIDSTSRNPSHLYDSVGNYTVSLTVTDTDGNNDTKTRTNYIRVSEILIQQTVSPDNPATVKTSDEQIILDFPQGSVAADTVVTIRKLPDTDIPPCPSGFRLGNTVFSVDLSGNLVPGAMITVTVKYSTADLQACDGNPDKLKLARYDENAGTWVVLPTTVDTEAMTLTANTDQFSTWSVMVDEAPAEPAEGTALWLWLVASAGGLIALIVISSTIIIVKRRTP